MARTKQKLINYHSSGTTAVPAVADLNLGEIAIQHGSKSGATIYTKVGDSELAKFITEEAIDAKISAVTGGDLSTAKQDIEDLKSSAETTSAAIEEIKNDLLGSGVTKNSSVTSQISSAFTAISANTTLANEKIKRVSEGTDSPYLTVETNANKEVTVTFTKGTGDDELATVKAVTDSAQTLSDDISALTAVVGDSDSGLVKMVADLQTADTDIRNEIAGAFTSGKTYVDGQVSAVTKDLDALEAIVGSGFTSASTVKAQIDAEASRAAGVEETLSAANTELGDRIEKLEKISGATNSALQSVGNGTYITVSTKGTGTTQNISAVTATVASATGTTKGLAEASDVKAYVDSGDTALDNKISTLSDTVDAQGEVLKIVTGTSGTSGSIAEAKAVADDVKKSLDAFLADSDTTEKAINTLKEIQEYIKSDSGVSADFVELKNAVNGTDTTSGLTQKLAALEESLNSEAQTREAADTANAEAISAETQARTNAIGNSTDSSASTTVYGAINKVAADLATVSADYIKEVCGSTYVTVTESNQVATVSVSTGEGGLALQSSLASEAETRAAADTAIEQKSVTSATVNNLSGVTATVTTGTTGATLTIDGANLVIDCGTF